MSFSDGKCNTLPEQIKFFLTWILNDFKINAMLSISMHFTLFSYFYGLFDGWEFEWNIPS